MLAAPHLMDADIFETAVGVQAVVKKDVWRVISHNGTAGIFKTKLGVQTGTIFNRVRPQRAPAIVPAGAQVFLEAVRQARGRLSALDGVDGDDYIGYGGKQVEE